jgi:maltose/moltooligosaccharide transporter
VKWSFYLGDLAFFAAVMYTVFTTKELPPADLEEFKENRKKTSLRKAFAEPFTGIAKMPKTMRQLAWVQFFSWFALFAMWIYSTNAVTSNVYDMKVSRPVFEVMQADITQRLTNFSGTPEELKHLRNLERDLSDALQFQPGKGNVTISINLANHYAESGLFIDNDLKEVEKVKANYNDGADWLNICSSVRNLVAAVFAFVIPMIASRTSRKLTHMICLVIGGIGLLSLRFIADPMMIAVSMGLVGVAWASILSMPYAMLAGALPADRMGYFMGVFNFFIVIPQIVAGTILGYLTVHAFGGNTMSTIALGGITMIFAGLITLKVRDDG